MLSKLTFGAQPNTTYSYTKQQALSLAGSKTSIYKGKKAGILIKSPWYKPDIYLILSHYGHVSPSQKLVSGYALN